MHSDKHEKNLSVMLEFKGEVLPKLVMTGFMRYNVRAYIPPPLRCYKCQKYGHIAAYCKGKHAKGAGGEHEYSKCGPGAQLKCSNCGEAHSVSYRECEVRKRAKEIQQMRVENRMSYAEAAKRVQGNQEKGMAPQHEGLKTCCRVKDDTLIVKKEHFLYFLAEVINCTSQARHKSEITAIIVKSAAKYLDIKGITWEQVYKELKKERLSTEMWSQSQDRSQ